MEIYDINDKLIENPDLEKGRIKNEKKTIHHDAIEAVEEQYHYETLKTYPNGGKDVKKIIDVKGVKAQNAYDEEVNIQRYILFTEEELKAQLEQQKEDRISYSKQALKDYLANNPMKWLDGKYYSVTSEKQSLLTSNLALYQVSAAAGSPFRLTWNSTGEECTEWTYENLCALALAIGSYVKPFVSRQQELEIKIKDCTTKDELNTIEIKY